jgi:hypothetical protein
MPSSKIPLYVKSHTNNEGMTVTRVVAYVGLLKNDGELLKVRAIVDIGAPVSLIPFSVWSWCPVELGKQRFVQLVSGRKECDLEVYEGKVTIALFDEAGNMLLSGLTIEVDLCATSGMPTLLGVHDFLERGCLHVDYRKGEAWVEM